MSLVGLGCIGLGWVGAGWVGLGCVGLGWGGLGGGGVGGVGVGWVGGWVVRVMKRVGTMYDLMNEWVTNQANGPSID